MINGLVWLGLSYNNAFVIARKSHNR